MADTSPSKLLSSLFPKADKSVGATSIKKVDWKKTSTSIFSIDKSLLTLNKSFGIQSKKEDQRNRDLQQLLKQKERPSLINLLGEKKDKKEEDKKNGIMEMLGGLLQSAPLIAALGSAFTAAAPVIGGAIAGVIAAYLGKKVFDATVAPATNASNNVGRAIQNATGGGSAGGKYNFDSQAVTQYRNKRLGELNPTGFEQTFQGKKPLQGEERDKATADVKASFELDKMLRQKRELNNQIYNVEKERLPEEIKKLETIKKSGGTNTGFGGVNEGNVTDQLEKQQAVIDDLKRTVTTLKYNQEVKIKQIEKKADSRPWMKEGILNEMKPVGEPLKKAKGGHIKVPGSGSGDKMPFMLPSGSFIMNRNAAGMMATGGMVPTLLEPGETIHPPGTWDASHVTMNSLFSRFAEGGEVATKSDNKGDSTLKILGTTDKLVGFGAGLCTKSVARTLDANQIRNPATNADPNNPRGYAIGLVNNYGWKTVGGTPTQLSGADGSASMGIMSHSNYQSLVSANQIPSGAIIMSTKHKDWLGNSSGGYDTAIARSGGNQLFNGNPPNAPMNTPSVYGGATTSNMVLVPSGSTLKGDFTGGSGDIAGVAKQQSVIEKLLGGLSGLGGGIGEVVSGVIGEFIGIFGAAGNDFISAIFPGLSGGLFGQGAEAATGPGATTGFGQDASGTVASGDAVAGAKMFMSAGFPPLAASILSGNVQTESQWQPNRKPWVLNDGAGTNKGLISWNRSRITNAEKFLGKPLETATAAEQVNWIKKELGDYGLLDDFMNPKASKEQLKSASKKYIGWGELRDRWSVADSVYKQIQEPKPKTGMQTGGVVGSVPSTTTTNFRSAQNKFIEDLASASSGGNTIIVNGGGGSGGGSTVVPSSSMQGLPPELPNGPSAVQAADYFYRIHMGSVC